MARIVFTFLAFSMAFFLFIPDTGLAARKVGEALSQVEATLPTAGIEKRDVQTIVGQLIKAALGLVGLIFFGLMIYGGFLWMTARGNSEQVDKAKAMVRAAIIGVAIVVAAYALTATVLGRLIK